MSRHTFHARTWKDGDHWLIECAALDVMTQGKTLTDAHVMLKDAIETLVNKPGWSVKVAGGSSGNVEVIADDPGPLLQLQQDRAHAAPRPWRTR